mmetsp:Transcript_34640/g.91370  ORF Transcript_34640/g.91370 Transcript_34640/m.91370 type:complete len:225 (+) Transcript_34640:163-837(+)
MAKHGNRILALSVVALGDPEKVIAFLGEEGLDSHRHVTRARRSNNPLRGLQNGIVNPGYGSRWAREDLLARGKANACTADRVHEGPVGMRPRHTRAARRGPCPRVLARPARKAGLRRCGAKYGAVGPHCTARTGAHRDVERARWAKRAGRGAEEDRGEPRGARAAGAGAVGEGAQRAHGALPCGDGARPRGVGASLAHGARRGALGTGEGARAAYKARRNTWVH